MLLKKTAEIIIIIIIIIILSLLLVVLILAPLLLSLLNASDVEYDIINDFAAFWMYFQLFHQKNLRGEAAIAPCTPEG